MTKTLWFGGSFNPIHWGHIRCAQAVARNCGFGRVVLVPSARPPHKQADATLASSHDRLAMCRLAVADESLFDVDDIETRRPGASFTIDTVRELKSRGAEQVHWLIGADMLNDLPRWHRPLDLLQEAEILVVARPGFEFDWSSLPPEFQVLRDRVVEAPLLPISGTDIRQRVAAGLPINHLTPPAVASYIETHGLYRTPDPAAAE